MRFKEQAMTTYHRLKENQISISSLKAVLFLLIKGSLRNVKMSIIVWPRSICFARYISQNF